LKQCITTQSVQSVMHCSFDTEQPENDAKIFCQQCYKLSISFNWIQHIIIVLPTKAIDAELKRQFPFPVTSFAARPTVASKGPYCISSPSEYRSSSLVELWSYWRNMILNWGIVLSTRFRVEINFLVAFFVLPLESLIRCKALQ